MLPIFKTILWMGYGTILWGLKKIHILLIFRLCVCNKSLGLVYTYLKRRLRLRVFTKSWCSWCYAAVYFGCLVPKKTFKHTYILYIYIQSKLCREMTVSATNQMHHSLDRRRCEAEWRPCPKSVDAIML